MYTIHCHICDTRYLVGPSSIDSFHNTTEGPVAYLRCPRGHHLMRNFRHDIDMPVPEELGAAS